MSGKPMKRPFTKTEWTVFEHLMAVQAAVSHALEQRFGDRQTPLVDWDIDDMAMEIVSASTGPFANVSLTYLKPFVQRWYLHYMGDLPYDG